MHASGPDFTPLNADSAGPIRLANHDPPIFVLPLDLDQSQHRSPETGKSLGIGRVKRN